MNKIIVFIIFTFSIPFYAQTILSVDFETPDLNYTITNGGIFSTEDYITRSFNGDPAADHIDFNGIQGTYYLAGRDIHGQTGIDSSATLNISDINVAGLDAVDVTLSIGAKLANEYESIASNFGSDYVIGEYSFNGVDWIKFAQFTGNSTSVESIISEDLNLNGVGDGSALNDNIRQFLYNIPTSGNTLKLRFEIYNSSSQEVFAIDNIIISGGTPLITPQNLMTVSVTSSQCDLEWDIVAGISLYHIYRSTDPYGTFTEVGTSATTSFTDTGVSTGNKYFYYVTADISK
ncbi:MAG: fibronectin type III domain-containing protein [Candidatus Delongbacteria bacterium]|jgi:hypothetical protein|nr:fibronectin type III domain-containing protein [Candidatus Delongbacteria bacterium]